MPRLARIEFADQCVLEREFHGGAALWAYASRINPAQIAPAVEALAPQQMLGAFAALWAGGPIGKALEAVPTRRTKPPGRNQQWRRHGRWHDLRRDVAGFSIQEHHPS